jgi:Uma2 family endonuclease
MALLQEFPEKLITGEELFRRPDLGPCELVNGRVVPLTLTGFAHGSIELELGSRLSTYSKETGRGQVASGDVGIYIRRDPDTVRGADVIYISHERVAQSRSKNFLEVAPELVVEVLSPTDRWSYLMEKVADYFSAGVLRVWVANPRTSRILVYRSPESFVELGVGEVLRDEELLPGFSLPIAEIFNR